MPIPDNTPGKLKDQYPFVLGGTRQEADYWMKDVGIKYYNYIDLKQVGFGMVGMHPWLIVLVGNWKTLPFMSEAFKLIRASMRPGGRIVELVEN